MKIGFIGHGNMAKALAGKWASRHRIMISGRNAYRTEIVAETLGVLVGTPAEAVAFGDVVVLTTPFENVFDAIEISGGAAAFAGKIAIDVINPLDPDSLHILRTKERSLTETIGKALPGALLAKAFNMADASVWADPSLTYDAHPMVALFTADMGAEAVMAELIADIGANPVKLGDNSYAYQLEGRCGDCHETVRMRGRSPHDPELGKFRGQARAIGANLITATTPRASICPTSHVQNSAA